MKLLNIILATFLLFLSLITVSTAETENSTSSSMLTPVILTLAIPENKKNDPDVIAATQDKVLESLKNFHIENVKRYRYTPLLALSVDQAGLDMLQKSDDILTISNDGLSRPHTTKPEVDSPQQEKSPCNRNAKRE